MQNYQKEKEASLRLAERQCSSLMMLGNETVHMLNYLSKSLPGPFYRAEIIDRLAAMLDYNLVQLVGPKCTELKVRNPEKYSFNPKYLLSEIFSIYLNLCQIGEGGEKFIAAVGRDERSYARETFEKALLIVKKNLLAAPQDCTAFQQLIQLIEESKLSWEEEEIKDIPEEFLDPLMFCLMEDPVTLLTSNVTLDRSTIVSHMLNDKTDPFNRQPLSLDQIVENTELKKRVEEFKRMSKTKGNKSE